MHEWSRVRRGVRWCFSRLAIDSPFCGTRPMPCIVFRCCREAIAWHAPVAQRIEHLTTDQKVRGSNPFGRTTAFNRHFRLRSGRLRPVDDRLRPPLRERRGGRSVFLTSKVHPTVTRRSTVTLSTWESDGGDGRLDLASWAGCPRCLRCTRCPRCARRVRWPRCARVLRQPQSVCVRTGICVMPVTCAYEAKLHLSSWTVLSSSIRPSRLLFTF